MNYRIIFFLYLGLLMLLLFSACQTTTPNPQVDPPPPVDQETQPPPQPQPLVDTSPTAASPTTFVEQEQAETLEPSPVGVQPARGGTLVVAVGEDPGHFNPGITTAGPTHAVADSLFNGLVALDNNANPIPDLAERWDISDDATTYTFYLVQAVTWHDGEPFTSEDVKFTFENILLNYHSRTKAGLENILEEIETPDSHTVVFRFSKPYAPLLQRLDVTEAPILPKHIYEGIEDITTADKNLRPVGTGPFVLESYMPGVEIRFLRNENYFKPGLPYLDAVVFSIIPNANTQVQALEAGDVDFVWRVPGADVERLSRTPQVDILSVATGPGGGYCIMTLTFNLENEILQDNLVRQAFAHAINRQQILEQVIFGQGRVPTAPISSEITWAHLADGRQYDYDPERAEDMLDEAGYLRLQDGMRFSVDFVHFPTFSKYGELMRQQLAQVGIDFVLRPLERDAAIVTIFNQRDFDTNIISYCNNTDPEIGVRRMYVSTNIGPIPFSNGASYVNPEIDRLFEQAAATAGIEARSALYHEIQRILLDDLPYWWIVETDFSVGVRSNCHDFQAWSGQFAEQAWCK
jgi:peptide/nickel transport system substrate-binding protein